MDGSPEKWCKSAKYLNTCRDSDDHGGGGKVGSCIYIHANCKHVVGSHDEPQEPDGYHGSNHSYISEGFFFAGVIRYDVRNYSKAWENENINFWVAEESEQVLVENGVTTSCWVEERGI